MFGILGLGFLLGMQHALEADHIAAVSSIAAAAARWPTSSSTG
jgi:high-affinity nickel permease